MTNQTTRNVYVRTPSRPAGSLHSFNRSLYSYTDIVGGDATQQQQTKRDRRKRTQRREGKDGHRDATKNNNMIKD